MSHFRNHILKAVEIAGSQQKLADMIGCTQQQISYLLGAKSISAEMAIKIERATGGAISFATLRPDLSFPAKPAPQTDLAEAMS